MATRQIHIGSLIGFHVYDDSSFPDGLSTDGPMRTTNPPSASNDVIRNADVGGGGPVAPADAAYVVIVLDGDLSAERALTAGTGISLADGGANGNVTLSTDDSAIDHDALLNFVANEHIDWTSASDDLQTGDAKVNKSLITTPISPAQITSNQNDYAIGGEESFVRLSSDASRTITGITAGISGQHLYIVNVGANDIVLANQNVSSSAANRLITGTGADATLGAGRVAILIYDGVTARWRAFA